jgi:hypothetical protein
VNKKELIKNFISKQSAHSFLQIQRLALVRDFLKDSGMEENTYSILDSVLFSMESEREISRDLKELEKDLGLNE